MPLTQPEDRSGGTEGPLSVLLLCDDRPSHAGTILDHIAALRDYSRHRVQVLNPCGVQTFTLLDLDEFDVVIIHYSLYILGDYYLAPALREKIRAFQGLKVQFIQDDYRQVDQMCAMMRFLGIHILYTLVPSDRIPLVWSEERLPGVLKITTLAGYIPDRLVGMRTRPLARRPIAVGYRGRSLPFWLGRLGQEKALIAQGFLERSQDSGLSCDISWTEEARVYGDQWDRFVGSCRATLGTESGASITDFDGSLQRTVEAYLLEHPSASFEDVFDEVLAPFEGNVPMNVISPRVFEAIVHRTPLVMFPGEYLGVVAPEQHYIPLEKDFSNFPEVVRRLKDAAYLADLADRAYQEIVESDRYSYREFVRGVDATIEKHAPSLEPQRRPWKLGAARAELALRRAVPTALEQRYVADLTRVWAALQVLRRYRFVRDFFRNAVRDQGVRGIGLRTLLRDVMYLGFLYEAQSGTIRAGAHYRVSAEVSGTALRLVSHLAPGPVPASDWAGIAAALRSGAVRQVQWDHSGVSTFLPYRLSQMRWLLFGERAGQFELEAVGAMLARQPEVAAPLLMAAVYPPSRRLNLLERVLGLRHYRRDAFGKALLGASLLVGTKTGRTLLRPWLRQRGCSPRALLEDVVRLTLLREAQQGIVRAGPAYRVSAAVNGAALRLVSHPAPEPAPASDWAGIEAALRSGAVRQVQWDHTRVSTFLPYRLSRMRWLLFGEGQQGQFDLEAVGALMARQPEIAAPLLMAALQPARPGLFWRLVRLLDHPSGERWKGLLGIRLLLVTRTGRGLLRVWLRQRGCSRRALLEDVVRLQLLREAQQGIVRAGPAYRVSAAVNGAALRLVSHPAPGPVPASDWAGIEAALRSGAVRQVQWDHSGVSTFLPYRLSARRCLRFGEGQEGRLELRAVGAAAEAAPGETARLLLAALRPCPASGNGRGDPVSARDGAARLGARDSDGTADA